jgi:hypothetical protein
MSLIPLGFWAASGGGFASDFDLLETVSLSTSASSVTFSGLAAYATDYKNLQVRYTARDSSSGGRLGIQLINNDSGTNYTTHSLFARGSSVSSTSDVGKSYFWTSTDLPGSDTTANVFGAGVVDILDPFETTKKTTFRTLSGHSGSDSSISLVSGLWNNDSAISSFQMFPFQGTSFAQYSRFSLYGVK